MTPHLRTAHRSSRALVTGAGLAALLGLGVALTLPQVRADREAGGAVAVRAQLQRVVQAQDAWRAEHGTYTTQLTDLGVVGGDSDVAIVRAETDSLCVGAYDGRSRTSLFYSVPGGLSATACVPDPPRE